MEEKNAHRKPIEENDVPISVPSVDAAWNDMRKKLDREKPIAELVPDSGMKGVSKISFNWLSISITLISIIAVIFFMLKNIDPVSQIVTANQNVSSGEKKKSEHEADKSSREFDVHTNEPNVEPNKSNQLISDSVNTVSPINDILTNEKQQDLKSIVIADGGIGKPFSGYKLNNRQTRYSKPINGKKNKNFFPANLKLHNPESKIAEETPPMAITSISNVDETPAVANTNTFQVEDQNELTDSNQIRLVDSTSMSKREISGSDTSGLKKLHVSINIGAPDTIENSDKWQLQAGLSWFLQLPISGTRGYFQGPNTNSQPYRILFPAIWLQSETKKSMLSIEINPFISNLLAEKPFRTSTTVSYLPDTTVTTTEVKTLYKVFGLSTSIGYNYNLSKNWWIGGSMQFCWWAKGIAYSNGLVQRTPVNGGSSAPDSYFQREYQISDEWSYFNRAQFFINAEFLYRKEKWQAGITSGISAAPLAKNEGPGNSFRMVLFYRWALFSKR